MGAKSVITKDAQRFAKIPIVANALSRLERELPATFYYHDYAHTVDVLNEAILFGLEAGLDESSLELLAIAAAYHDIAFIEDHAECESQSAKLALQAMKSSGNYGEDEMQLVQSMILDTEVRFLPEGPRQVATTELSKYLCDADVSNLGRDDFAEKSELLRRELKQEDLKGYLQQVIRFLSSHRWYTPVATKMRQATKERNLQQLQARVAELA